MNTQASSILMMIFEIIVVILVVVIVSQAAVGFAKSDTVVKVNTATDLALMVNTLIGTPGDGVTAYPYNVSKYTFILSSGSVMVITPDEPEFKRVTRTFNLPKGFSAEGVVENKERLCLEKNAHKLILRECNKNES
ncbi:hypothetical protein HZC32_02835 [Candidatus Woesearchaeota archaeon]|nr:hypothetical protein [Candidatus Woesearchaeota archaeon]